MTKEISLGLTYSPHKYVTVAALLSEFLLFAQINKSISLNHMIERFLT